MVITILLTIFYPHTQHLLTIKYYYYGLNSYETNKLDLFSHIQQYN